MPYGNSGPDLSYRPFQIDQDFNGRLSVIGPSWSMNRVEKPKFIRSGTNFFPMQKSTSCKKYTVPMKSVSRQVPGGPRLAYKIFIPKLGRSVWARAPITVYKLVPDYSKVKHATGLDIPPNALSYKGVKVIRADDFSTAKAVWDYDDHYKRTLSGALYQNLAIGPIDPCPLNPDTSYLDIADYSDLIEIANRKAIAKLYSAAKHQEVNLLNALGERKQTIATLSSMVVRLAATFHHAKKLDLPKAWKTMFPPGQVQKANDYLLLTYGIKPLIDDINGLVKHLNDWEPLTFDIRVSSTMPIDVPTESVTFNRGVYFKGKLTREGKVTVVYKFRVKTKDSFKRNLGRLGLTNLGATLWELTPWSFVIDWILPYGNYLNSSDGFYDLEVTQGSKTIFISENSTYSRDFNGKDSDGWKWSTSDACIFQMEKTLCVRSLVSAPPELAFPSIKNPVSPIHGLNFLALVRQFMR